MQPAALREPKREIDLRQVSANDLEEIEKQDPFMYFSIPEVRDAKLHMREIDMTKLREGTVRRNCVSCPSRLQSVQENSSCKVSRKTVISYECHPDELMKDWMNEDVSDDEFDGIIDLDDEPIHLDHFILRRR